MNGWNLKITPELTGKSSSKPPLLGFNMLNCPVVYGTQRGFLGMAGWILVEYVDGKV